MWCLRGIVVSTYMVTTCEVDIVVGCVLVHVCERVVYIPV